jgi:hypothetical protein
MYPGYGLQTRRNPMSNLINFAQAELNACRPSTVREEIRKALRDQPLWATIEPLILPPGKQGSKEYDHAIVVDRILQWDAKNNNGKIASFGMSPRLLWDHAYAVLGGVFKVGRGRVIGLLENKPADPEAAEAAAANEPGDSIE